MAQTPFEYYGDEDNWGQYQFVSLKEVLNFLVLQSQQDDSYIKNAKRSMLLAYAKQGVRKLNRSVANKVSNFQIQVPSSLKWALPQDYVGYKRISRFVFDENTSSYRLRVLDINYDIPTAPDYLQDHAYELLFDSEGYILQSEGINAISKPYIKVKFEEVGGQSMKDTSKWSKNGEFSIDENRGIIVFSSDLADQFVLIEYVSDGLEGELWGEDVKIHKNIREALQDYIVYEYLSASKNADKTDKRDAKNKWLASRHEAVMNRTNFDFEAIARVSRKKSMTP